jgi:dihydroorotate dehydrogenase
MANMARRFDDAGADALVLFNRFYQPDIDLGKLDVALTPTLSVPKEMLLPLRWVGILHGRIRANLAASGGIHRGSDAIKMLLASGFKIDAGVALFAARMNPNTAYVAPTRLRPQRVDATRQIQKRSSRFRN